MVMRGHIFVFLLGWSLLAFAGCKPAADPQAKPAAQPVRAGAPVVPLGPKEVAEAGLEFETVQLGGHKTTLRVPGVVKPNPNHLAEISPLIPGRVIQATANIGDRVRPGQVLARVNSTDLGLAQSEYLKTQARLAVAERALERARQLLEAKVIATGEYQRREGDTLAARADHRAAVDRLILLGMTPSEVQLLAREQRIHSKATIRSPLAGTVIERHVTIGEVVDSKTVLFVIADLRQLLSLIHI